MSGAYPLSRILPGEDAGKPSTLPLKYFFNGNIRTLNAAHPLAPHMLVAGEKIWFCSDRRAPLGLDFRESGFRHQRMLYDKEIEFIDLEGRTVLPSFADAHVHFLWWALTAARPDLSPARSAEEAVALLTREVGSVARGEWILGHGWSHNFWPDAELPTKELLDAAFPHNPVYLTSKCGHLAWLNSQALKLVGIDAHTPNPPGGEICKTGRPDSPQLTGILKEDAVLLVERSIPPPSGATKRHAFIRGQLKAHALGMTALHTPEDLDTWDFYAQMRGAGLLRLRVAFLIPAAELDAAINMRLRWGVGDDLLFVAGVKIFADGSLGARTALMHEPYEGEPENCGTSVRSMEEIAQVTIRANRAGLPVAAHAIGDRAVAYVLRAFHMAAGETGCPGAADTRPLVRNRIEHLQLVAPHDLDLLRSLRPVASVQPVHLCADWRPADKHWGRRARYAYAFRTLVEAGCPLAFGTDAPVEPINPWFGVYAAVTRQDLEGQPPYGWYPEERLPLEQALAAYTVGSAQAAGKHLLMGTLQPGKYADFVVLDEDPWHVAPTDLRNLSVAQTYFAGECVYKQRDE
ncbi:MAG: amidohydrolase [Candidatus Sumerlaeaceae bacterium]